MESQLSGIDILLSILVFGILILFIVSLWKIFTKAGKPGWASIIPIYNLVVLLEIIKKPLWWILLLIIPVVSIIISIVMYVELSKKFGKSTGFGVGLVLLPFIFFPILAFGDAKYLDESEELSTIDHLVS